MAINDYIRTSSTDIEGDLNVRRSFERNLYDKLLLGQALRVDVGQDIVATNPTARPPSWTQHHAGINHSFVMTILSSSQHAKTNLNTFKSGTEPLEVSAVPASGNVYYTKQSRFVKRMYKLSASADLGTYVPASGVYLGTGAFVHDFVLNVPDRGKIRDIKVWVEMAHVSASQTSAFDFTPDTDATIGPLSMTAISLISPNVHFYSAHPILNDGRMRDSINQSAFTKVGPGVIPPHAASSYLLWEGSVFFAADILTNDYRKFPTWNRDRHMRTIFSDNAVAYNPRHLEKVILHGGDVNSLFDNAPNDSFLGFGSGLALGCDVPWMTDVRLIPGPHTSAGSPPAGWLTGPAGTNAAGEYATTGSNYGPEKIKPMYPLLDDIIAVKRTVTGDNDYIGIGTIGDGYPFYKSWIGFRPGLRGTEVQGDWRLRIAMTGSGTNQITPQGAYFRQFRLEFILDVHEDDAFYTKRRFPRKSNIGIKQGSRKLYATISGTSGVPTVSVPPADYYPNLIYYVSKDEPWRTVGITDNSASFSDTAVFTRLTGALADVYATSGHAAARIAYLSNEFGTPFIPLSSGSGTPVVAQELISVDTEARERVFALIQRRNDLAASQHILSVMARSNVLRKSSDLFFDAVTGSR